MLIYFLSFITEILFVQVIALFLHLNPFITVHYAYIALAIIAALYRTYNDSHVPEPINDCQQHTHYPTALNFVYNICSSNFQVKGVVQPDKQ